MTRSETIARVGELLAAWNGRDLDAFVALFAADAWWHDLAMTHPPAAGRDAIRDFCDSFLRAFPDFRYEVRGSICVSEDGASCCVPWTITATHTAVLDPPGYAPTNRQARIDGLDYIVFENGYVRSIETRFDPADAAGQLIGFELRPIAGSWPERALVTAQRIAASFARRRVENETS
jgi:hypothetical protein